MFFFSVWPDSLSTIRDLTAINCIKFCIEANVLTYNIPAEKTGLAQIARSEIKVFDFFIKCVMELNASSARQIQHAYGTASIP
jgi:hypothetical protein